MKQKSGRLQIASRVALILFASVFLLSILFPKKAMVISFILGGKVVAPEASAILSHYCFGDGDTLYLKSDYIKNSPVVKRALKGLKVGQSRRVAFRQREDWRLSYAFNPFSVIKRTKDAYELSQYMLFDKSGRVKTKLNLWLFKITVKDDIVHTFDCRPFWAVCRFSY